MKLCDAKYEIEKILEGYARRIERDGVYCEISFEFNDSDCEECDISDKDVELFFADLTVKASGDETGFELSVGLDCKAGEIKDESYREALCELDGEANEFIRELDGKDDALAYIRERAAAQAEAGKQAIEDFEKEIDALHRKSRIALIVGIGVIEAFAAIAAIFGF